MKAKEAPPQIAQELGGGLFPFSCPPADDGCEET